MKSLWEVRGPDRHTDFSDGEPDMDGVPRTDAERAQREREVDEAEAPIVADLRRAGMPVESLWDVDASAFDHPGRFPVLLRHLREGDYPELIRARMAIVMNCKDAAAYWDDLVRLYAAAVSQYEAQQLADVLATCATKARYDDLVRLVTDASMGQSRSLLLRAVKRLGGTPGAEFLASLRDDPALGTEARRLTKPRPQRRPTTSATAHTPS